MTNTVPLKFTASTCSMSSGVSSSSLPDGKMPALAQTMSRPPCALDGGFDSAATILRVRHIGRQAAHSPGLAGEVGDRGVEVGLVARGYQYVDAGGGEGFGDAAADPLAAAGDDGGTAVK